MQADGVWADPPTATGPDRSGPCPRLLPRDSPGTAPLICQAGATGSSERTAGVQLYDVVAVRLLVTWTVAAGSLELTSI
jgi:hypothetical protein